jgi:hypothetical protein
MGTDEEQSGTIEIKKKVVLIQLEKLQKTNQR